RRRRAKAVASTDGGAGDVTTVPPWENTDINAQVPFREYAAKPCPQSFLSLLTRRRGRRRIGSAPNVLWRTFRRVIKMPSTPLEISLLWRHVNREMRGRLHRAGREIGRASCRERVQNGQEGVTPQQRSRGIRIECKA